MADLVLRRGLGRDYLSIECDPCRQRDPEIWRIDLPAGMTLRQARRLYDNGVRPEKRHLKPSLQLVPREEPKLFNEQGNYLPGYHAAKQVNHATFGDAARAIISGKRV